MPFIMLTRQGGVDRNPIATRLSRILGNVSFLERPFHPTTLVSVAVTALRGRRRQYEARARLDELGSREAQLRELNATLESRIAEAVDERALAEEALRQSQKMEVVGQLTAGWRMISTTCSPSSVRRWTSCAARISPRTGAAGIWTRSPTPWTAPPSSPGNS